MGTIEATIDQQHNMTVSTVTGEVTSDDLIQRIEANYAAGPTLNMLWDFTNGSMASASAEALREIVSLVSELAEPRTGGKTALVVGKASDFGLSRMLEALAEVKGIPFQVQSFYSMSEARQWLGLED